MPDNRNTQLLFWPLLFLAAWLTGTSLMGSGDDGQAGKTPRPATLTPTANDEPGGLGSSERLNEPLRAFLGLAPQEPLTPQKLAEAGVQLKTLVASVPDPVDTETNYYFDSVLEAIYRGLGADQFVLDRFYLPWQEYLQRSEIDSKLIVDPAARVYVSQPGVLLFRKIARTPVPETKAAPAPKSESTCETKPETKPKPESTCETKAKLEPGPAETGEIQKHLLQVYLVGETPTAGIHHLALRAALSHAGRMRALAGTAKGMEPLTQPVLGPFFTGSADSLAMGLGDFNQRMETAGRSGVWFDVVAGSATGVDVEKFGKLAGAKASFVATTLHVTAMRDALCEHVAQAHLFRANGRTLRIAWLVEGNTGYGMTDRKAGQATATWKAVNIPFPLHISRVRSIHAKANADEAQALPQSATGRAETDLSFDETESGREQPPHFAPAVTTAAVELVLRQIVGTIEREGVQYVGIMATDARDRIFLASFVRDRCPGVQLLVLNGDLLYLHSDAAQALSGALVVSPYPLFPDNQHWSYPACGDAAHLVFSSGLQTGCYNAIRVLLHPECRKTGSASGDYDRLQLLEYGPPLEPGAKAGPPAWISVIGQDTAWPVAAIDVAAQEPAGYTFRFDPPANPGAAGEIRGHAKLRFPRAFMPAAILLFLVGPATALALVWPASSAGGDHTDRFKDVLRPFLPASTVKPGWCDWCWIAACTLPLALLLLGLGWLTDSATILNQSLDRGLAYGVQALAYWGALLLVAACVLRLLTLSTAFGSWIGLLPHKSLGTAIVVASILMFMAVVAAVLIWPRAELPSAEATFRFLRNFGRGGEVSLFRASLLMVLVLYVWGYSRLKGRYLEGDYSHDLSLLAEQKTTEAKEVTRAAGAVQAALAGEWRNRATRNGGLLAAAALWCGYLWLRSLPTLEGRWPSLLVALAIALCIALLVLWLAWISDALRALKKLLRAAAGLDLCSAFDRTRDSDDSGLERFLSSRRPRKGEIAAEQKRRLDDFQQTAHELNSLESQEVKALAASFNLAGAAAFTARRVSKRVPGLQQSLSTAKFMKLAETDKPAAAIWRRLVESAEALAAVEIKFYLRGIVGRFRNLVTGAIIAVGLFFAAVAAYPFHPHRGLLLTAALLAAGAAYLLLAAYVRLDRDPVLCAIVGTHPDRLDIDWQFIAKVTPVALVFAGLIISQFFPDAWYWLRSWITPFVRVGT